VAARSWSSAGAPGGLRGCRSSSGATAASRDPRPGSPGRDLSAELRVRLQRRARRDVVVGARDEVLRVDGVDAAALRRSLGLDG
jgi:hypothetical protein